MTEVEKQIPASKKGQTEIEWEQTNQSVQGSDIKDKTYTAGIIDYT